MNKISKVIVLGLFLGLCSPAKASYMVGGWVPYWQPKTGTRLAKKRISQLDQISPFAYEVQSDRSIKNTFKWKQSIWNDLETVYKNKKKLFIPTVSWQYATKDIHHMLSDPIRRTKHIDSLLNLVLSNDLAGINIDYENIARADQDRFMVFIEELSDRLHAKNRLLHLSIGARTSDTSILVKYNNPSPVSTRPNKGGLAEKYKKVIGRCCDQVIVMAYDEHGIPYNRQDEYRKKKYYVSLASNKWVEQVIQYTLSFVPPHKLVLGTATYGLEFTIKDHSQRSIDAKKKKSILYTKAEKLRKKLNITAQRTPGGELSFCYVEPTSKQKRCVVYMDAQALKDKIDLVKKYNLKGIYFFSLYGEEDPAIWPMLTKEIS